MFARIRTFILLSITLFPLSGCLFRTHKVDRQVSQAALLAANLPELESRLNQQAAAIKTLNATVDIASSVGGSRKGKVTEFQEIRGYVLVREPGMLRMIGLAPEVRNRLFDMVSDGEQFKLSVPIKNKFVVGPKDVRVPSKQPFENLRPQIIMDSLIIRSVNANNEIGVLESGYDVVRDTKSKRDVDEPNYILDVIHHGADGAWLSRKIYFSRTDLLPRRQLMYDRSGNVVTAVYYNNFTMTQNVMFPQIILIERPQEEYSLQLSIVKLTLNAPLRDDQFELEQPPGSQLQVLEGASYKGETTSPAKGPGRGRFHY